MVIATNSELDTVDKELTGTDQAGIGTRSEKVPEARRSFG